MPIATGAESYMCPVMQDTWPDDNKVPTVTLAHLRTGNPVITRSARLPRISTTGVMPTAAQLWNTANTVDINYQFELIGNPTVWLPIFRAAWGKESATSATPNVRTYTIYNPPVNATDTDAVGPPALSYNRGLTIRHTYAAGGVDIKTYEVRDVCVNEFTVACNANETLRVGITGTGQNMQDGATMVAYSAPAGTVYNWAHLIAGANSGIYVGSANPPTTAMPVKSFQFTLNNNMRYEPFLGNASGQALKLPTRNGFPSASFEYELDFDDISATDAVSVMTDYIASTDHNVRIEAYIDASNSLELLASDATVKPSIVNEPQMNVGSEGPVSFRFRHDVYPDDTTADLKMVFTTAS